MFISFHRGDSQTSPAGGVFSSQMDGSAVAEIIQDSIDSPSHLQVDFIHRRIYVADTRLRVIESFTFEGTDRRVLLRGHHMSSFALFPDQIFWSEKNTIMTADW